MMLLSELLKIQEYIGRQDLAAGGITQDTFNKMLICNKQRFINGVFRNRNKLVNK